MKADPHSPAQIYRPQVMGILNVTPDSFSDGGEHLRLEAAIVCAARMVEEGADWIDVGGESTRPGSDPVSLQEEMDRVLPVIEAIRTRFDVGLSIDTYKPAVAHAALERGVTLVNDVSGGREIAMAELVQRFQAQWILMHMQGTPKTMQENPTYPRGVLAEVSEFFSARLRRCAELGILDRVWIDPGIGFGKSLDDNLLLFRELNMFVGLCPRVAVGVSRKSFLAAILSEPTLPFALREPGTLAANLWAYEKGARLFRVHDVGAAVRGLATWCSLRGTT